MTEEISKPDAENLVKPDPVDDDDVICDTEIRSPKRSRLSTDFVLIKTESADEFEKIDDEIKIIVKNSNEKRDIQIKSSSTISELRIQVSKSFKIPLEKVCLIFEGQVLKELETVANSKIEGGRTVHLVIKSNAGTSAGTESSPFGLSQLGAIPGLGSIGLGSPNFVNVQKQMESALQQNPDLFLQIMDNPFVQSIMENPKFLQQVITSNSQMAEMLETNPELSHVINNPDALRASLQHARNPELIQELIQSRAEAAAESSSVENKENEAASAAPKEDPKKETEEKDKGSEGVGPSLHSPPLQNIMKEMMEHPDLVREMFNAPYMTSMLEGLAANPQVASQIMVNNPIFANSTRDQVQRMLPAFLRQMQNPEMQNFVSNPQAMAAMMNIHQSLDQLQQAAPNVFNMFPGQPPVTSLLSPEGRSAPSEGSTQDTFSLFMRNMVNAMNQGCNPCETIFLQNLSQIDHMHMRQKVVHLLFKLNKTIPGNDSPPEERYKGQLEQMQMMGFINKQENLQALIATFGDVNSAVQRLLSQVP